MEVSGAATIIEYLLAVLCGGFGVLLVSGLLFSSIDGIRRFLRVRVRLSQGSIKSNGGSVVPRSDMGVSAIPLSISVRWVESLLLGIIDASGPRLQRIAASKTVSRICAVIEQKLSCAGISLSSRFALLVSVFSTIAVFLLVALVSGNLLIGCAMGCATPCLLLAAISRRGCKRIEMMRGQVPEGLMAIGTAVGAGYSLAQAFAYAERSIEDPLKSEFKQLNEQIAVGWGMTEALDDLVHRASISELELMASALEIQHRTGGSLREIIDSVSSSVRESYELSRSLSVKTSQARLSARVVGLTPLCIVGGLSLFVPDYLQTFFGSGLGTAVFVSALAMDMVGFVVIKRILSVDV